MSPDLYAKIRTFIHNQKQTYDWFAKARDSQQEPDGEWQTWLLMAGRGFGKTRTGAETIRGWVERGRCKRLALVGETLREGRDILVEGKSGLLRICPPWNRPIYEATKHRLVWPNGAVAYLYSGNNPEKLRGPEFDGAWVDELAKFHCPQTLWDQLSFCLRLGDRPRCLVTTTPRPLSFLEKLIQDPGTFVTRGTSFENKDNLSPGFLKSMEKRFAQTRLGSQELYGELLSERDGALWSRDRIVYNFTEKEDWTRIVIAIDPATTSHQHSDETGIIVAARLSEDRFVVLEDLSGRLSPAQWGNRVVEAYHRYQADRVVAEVNKGGDLVEQILKAQDPHIPFRPVRAMRGKTVRAEPIAALYEQGKVVHQKPLRELETQLCTYVQGQSSKSPDRLDALVWALTDLSQPANKPYFWVG